MKDMTTKTLNYLGISIEKVNGEIPLNQINYLKRVLDKWGMTEFKGCSKPNFKMNDSEIDMTYEYQCRSLIGRIKT